MNERLRLVISEDNLPSQIKLFFSLWSLKGDSVSKQALFRIQIGMRSLIIMELTPLE